MKNRRLCRAKMVVWGLGLWLAWLCLASCATVQPLSPIAKPPASPKLRVLILTVSGPPSGSGWAVPHEQFKQNIYRNTSQILNDQGIYEVVPEEDLRTALGTRVFEAWQWQRNDYALVKQVGQAVYADYAIIALRETVSRGDSEHKRICLNLASGKIFEESIYIAAGPREQNSAWLDQLLRTYVRKMFMAFKGDMLATAVRKARLLQGSEIKTPALPKPKVEGAPVAVAKKEDAETDQTLPAVAAIPQATPPLLKAPPPSGPTQRADKHQSFPPAAKETPSPAPATKPSAPLSRNTADSGVYPAMSKIAKGTADGGKNRLVVYDFDATGPLSVVSMILTEALREELFTLGRYTLVNRESIQQVMQEYKLQQVGLVNEKQIVELGKWLAANEAVTGRLTQLGSAYVLQVKRTDIQTLETLGFGSIRAAVGQEDDLLSRMPALAKSLTELKTTPK